MPDLVLAGHEVTQTTVVWVTPVAISARVLEIPAVNNHLIVHFKTLNHQDMNDKHERKKIFKRQEGVGVGWG